jgi:hypothetical protein
MLGGLLFFLFIAALPAQDRPELEIPPNLGVVPPETVVVPYTVITGSVSSTAEYREAADALYDAMSQELAWQSSIYGFYTVITSEEALPDIPSREELRDDYEQARYIITGTVSRDQYDEEFNLYTLTAWVPGNGTASRAVQVSSAFIDPQEVLDFIPFLVWQLTSVFPVDTVPLTLPTAQLTALPEDFAWKHKWLYLGLQLGGSFRFYNNPENKAQNVSVAFEPALRMEFQFLSFYWPQNYLSFSLLTGAALSMDNTVYRDYEFTGSALITIPVDFTSFAISIPMGIKVNYKPGPLSLGLYGGLSYDVRFQDQPTNSLPLGYNVGMEAGTHLGPGVIYLDLHYAADMAETVFPGSPGLRYTRRLITISVGYSFGLIGKPLPKAPPLDPQP